MDSPRVSVIVCVSRRDLAECSDSQLEQDAPPEAFEVIWVPHGDYDAPAVPGRFKTLLAPTPNPAVKRNLAADMAQGEWLAFLDDDAAAPQDWISRGLRLAAELPPGCMGFGGPNVLPRTATPGEALTDAVLNLPLLGSGGVAYRMGAPDEKPREARVGELHLVNFWIRRKDFLAAGGLNAALGYGGEDSEFMDHARRRHSMRFWWTPDFAVEHHRRPFGRAYLLQRFKLRAQSGRLMVLRPGIYAGRGSLRLALAAAAALVLLLLWQPLLALLAALLLPLFAALLARPLPSGVSRTRLALALPLHLATYALGLLWGWLDGWRLRLGLGLGARQRFLALRRELQILADQP